MLSSAQRRHTAETPRPTCTQNPHFTTHEPSTAPHATPAPATAAAVYTNTLATQNPWISERKQAQTSSVWKAEREGTFGTVRRAHKKSRQKHSNRKKATKKEHAQTLLWVDAVEHGSVLQHVWENHEAHVAAPQVTAAEEIKREHGWQKQRRRVKMKQRERRRRGNSHLLQTGHLAVLACKHDAAQLATHIVLCLDKPPTIHFAIAKLNCRRIGNTKNNCVETNSSR